MRIVLRILIVLFTLTSEASAKDDDRNAGASQSSSYSSVVAEARRYLNAGPGELGLRRTLWCAAFMNMVLERTGHKGGGTLALGYLRYGPTFKNPRVGALAVTVREGGGHVGVVSGITPSGDPVIVSGNHGNIVAEVVYPRNAVVGYVMPR